MKISWAVFGEKHRGHDLLASSGNNSFAKSIAQFTDRPGDPPLGLPWGPADSGFTFEGHYVFLRTIPDNTVGRAGMVRSYAAFVPLAEIDRISSIEAIFNQLPNTVVAPDSLQIIFQPEKPPLPTAQPIVLGLANIIEKLTTTNSLLPLVWAYEESHLSAIDSLWQRMPPGLKASFCFAFQFEPEHRLPSEPIIVATLPQLRGRWETARLITHQEQATGHMTSAERWLLGDASASSFAESLKRLGILEFGFGDLKLLSFLVDSVDTLNTLNFKDALKSIRILEKYLKNNNQQGEDQDKLFVRLASLVLNASTTEVIALRNLNSNLLSALIPLLRTGIRAWLEKSEKSGASISVLEIAIPDQDSWWSKSVLDWLKTICQLHNGINFRIVYDLIVALPNAADFILSLIPRTGANELKIIEGLPPRLKEIAATKLRQLAVSHDWMNLHAAVLVRSQEPITAISTHAKTVGSGLVGFERMLAALGALPLISVACTTEYEGLDSFVTTLLGGNAELFIEELVNQGDRWAKLLRMSLAQSSQWPNERVRELTILVVQNEASSPDAQMLAQVATKIDASIWLDMINPQIALDKFPLTQRESISAAVNDYLQDEIYFTRLDALTRAQNLQFDIDYDKVAIALKRVSDTEYANTGIRVFGCLTEMSDTLLRNWLIDLFTKTYQLGVTNVQATGIVDLLLIKHSPLSAEVVRDTAEHYYRSDVAPIWEQIRYKYQMTQQTPPQLSFERNVLPVVLIATALPLERRAVCDHLKFSVYDPELRADVGLWPSTNPIFEIWLLATGAGNLDTLSSVLTVLHKMNNPPALAFFVGVGGGVKDSEIGDVTYSTKVYYYEGGKEEDFKVSSRPNVEHTSETLVQLAIRVAESAWSGPLEIDKVNPNATPAVIASGEKVLTSIKSSAKSYRRIKDSMNDSQVVDMEGYGFLKACRQQGVQHAMVVRGVSDMLANKSETDAKGNQPLAATNAATFLFKLLNACADIFKNSQKGKKTKKRKKFLGLFCF